MVDSLDFSHLEKLTNKEKIDSHNSQLTNLRIHELEISLDAQRIIMMRSPTQDNIIACFGIVKAWFSYIQSIKQGSRKDDVQESFSGKLGSIKMKMNTMDHYTALIHHGVVSEELRQRWPQLVDGKKGNTPWNKIERTMVFLTNEIIDDLRTIYQSMNFYFRTSRNTEGVGGILGDLVNAKKKRGTGMNEGGEINEVVGNNERLTDEQSE